MLEPLYRCNLACVPREDPVSCHILKRTYAQECFLPWKSAASPLGPGGEPLMHPRIQEIVEGLRPAGRPSTCAPTRSCSSRSCIFQPSRYLPSPSMDGEKEHHDLSVCKEGGYEIALDAIREAVKAGFRVTTNTTVFEGVDSKSVRNFFTEMMDAGVEGMMISPGYSYDKAPDQQHFTGREGNQSMFRRILSNRDPRWRFNMSPLFLEFLMGKRNLMYPACPLQHLRLAEPCYLLQDGYTDSQEPLVHEWPKCYEPNPARQLHAAPGYGRPRCITHFCSKVFSPVRAMFEVSDAEACEIASGSRPALLQIEAIARGPR